MNIHPTIITARISGTANTEITARTALTDNKRNSIRRSSARRGSTNMVSGTANTEITARTAIIDNKRNIIRRPSARRGSTNMVSGTANTEITARTAITDNKRNSIRRPSARRGSTNMVSGTANTEITPSTDNRRISIRRSPARRGSINMARRHSLGANFFSGSSGDPHTHSGNATLCTCDAELMNEELRKFRTTSAEAIQNSWTEVETLQITSTEYDQRLDNLTSEVEIKTVKLQESLTCCNNLEEYLDTLTGNSSGRSSFIHSITEEVPSITEEGPIDSDSSSSINEDATNVHDHDHSSIDQEQEDQDARNCEILRLKQILIARNSTVDNMELLLIQNIKMMQTFQVELQELKESKRC